MDIEKDQVKVNKILGKRASIGPIPADQIVPWMIIGVLSFFIFRMLMGVSYMLWMICWVWLAATWWILTGEKTYAFIKSWVNPPGHDWLNAETLFIRATDTGTWKRMRKDRLNSVKVQTRNGVKQFMPFQNFVDLHSIAEVKIGSYSYGCLVLYNKAKDQWSAQIPLRSGASTLNCTGVRLRRLSRRLLVL